MSTTNSTFEFWNAFDSFMRYYNDIFDFKVGCIEFSDDFWSIPKNFFIFIL